MKKAFYVFTFFALTSILTFEGCAPIFSDLQGARMVGSGNSEFIGSYSSVSMDPQTDGVSSTKVQNELGIHYGYGINDDFDIRARFEWAWPSEEGGLSDGAGAIGFGPKIRIYKNYIAAYLPIGTGLGQASKDSWQVHPTMLFTYPINEKYVDVNASIKYLIPLQGKSDNLLALNLGFALSNDISKWSIRPEFGLLLNPGEDGYFTHFSIGFAGTIGK